jgi:soluble lytic murein transglycosylase-like protein
VIPLLLALLSLALGSAAGWLPRPDPPGLSTRRASPRGSAGQLRPEFCSLVVTGRALDGSVHLPWHEAVLSDFRHPFGGMFGPPSGEGEGERAGGLPAGDGARLPAASPEEQGRALLLAGRDEDAWRILSRLAPEARSEAAYLQAWAAARSRAREAPRLLRPFTERAAPLACRVPAARTAARRLAAEGLLRESLELLETLHRDLPEIPDHTLLWSLEARAEGGDAVGVDSLYRELPALAPSSAVVRAADLARAGLLERTGEPDRARALLAENVSRMPRKDRPVLLRRLAELELRLGERGAGETRLRQIVEKHPDSDEALELLEPGPSAGRPPIWLSARDRAAILAAHGRVREAVEALTPTTDPLLLRVRGDINLRSGSFRSAAADYEDAIARGGDPGALRMELAKAFGRAGQPARAGALYRELYDKAAGDRSATLVYLIADAFQEGAALAPAHADSAAEWFRLLVERFPGSRLAPRGLLRHAHLRYARAAWVEAETLYREYLRRYPGGEDAREARYWLARVVYKAGRPDEARALFAGLLNPGAADYYALLARRRLGGAPDASIETLFGRQSSRTEGAPPGPAARIVPLGALAERSLADTILPAGNPGERALRRARALLLAGEVEAAQREVDEAVRLSGGSRAELERVARWALAWGYPESAFRIGAALLPAAGTGFPAGEQQTSEQQRAEQQTVGQQTSGQQTVEERLARLAFPAAFAQQVSVEARETGLPAALLWGIMRQESRFDHAARSPAGALGLLQLMPATARDEAARARATSFDVRDLTRPEANLHLGALHLRRLVDSVGGERVAALAAYNAGFALANRWLGFPEARDPEGYVERIPFRETRNYVKQVIANQARYEDLYATP